MKSESGPVLEPRADLIEWLDDISGNDWIWFIKYLAANDTSATGAHQAGPLIGNDLFRAAFPALLRQGKETGIGEATIDVSLDSHDFNKHVRVVWYRSKGEGRITQWGGQGAPILDANTTGALVIFAFRAIQGRDADACRIWISRSPGEEDLVLERVGPVEPSGGLVYSPAGVPVPLPEESDRPCILSARNVPPRWLLEFPSGSEIIAETVARLPAALRKSADERLLLRRECEYNVFRSLERIVLEPRLREGFASVDIFVDLANTVLNRRKSRSGRSLELHAKIIFDEERLPYAWTERTEGKRTPDFIFPSINHYRDRNWPGTKLRMLAVKTTLKDRWRQILNEARRIPRKHLLTLQPGISEPQFREMNEENVVLVVPKSLLRQYPKKVQPYLLTFEQFIAETRAVSSQHRR